jgi:hypothetical protein
MPAERAKRILCVEDDLDTCKLVGAVLPGFEIISANTVKLAWQHYIDQKFSSTKF